MPNGGKEGAAVLKYVDALDRKKRVEQRERAWAAYHEFVAKMRAIEWDPMYVERTKLARQAVESLKRHLDLHDVEALRKDDVARRYMAEIGYGFLYTVLSDIVRPQLSTAQERGRSFDATNTIRRLRLFALPSSEPWMNAPKVPLSSCEQIAEAGENVSTALGDIMDEMEPVAGGRIRSEQLALVQLVAVLKAIADYLADAFRPDDPAPKAE